MKNYLNQLQEREKKLVLVGGLCLILFTYYQFLYAPLTQGIHNSTAQLAEKTTDLAWMHTVQPPALQTSQQVLDNSQLLTALATQLRKQKQGRFPYQLQQTGSGDIQVTFDKVPFQIFLAWLADFNQHYAFIIKQWEVDPTKIAGITRLMILLSAT